MNNLITQLELKISSLKTALSDEEIGTIVASLHDYTMSIAKVEKCLNKICYTDNRDEIQESLIIIQMELINHIKKHISDMENPLMKLINSLE
ncbi:MAG: hypothetical protein AB1521_16135 [Bacteroidota bacterium]